MAGWVVDFPKMVRDWRSTAEDYRRNPRTIEVRDPAASAVRLDHLADQLDAILAVRPPEMGPEIYRYEPKERRFLSPQEQRSWSLRHITPKWSAESVRKAKETRARRKAEREAAALHRRQTQYAERVIDRSAPLYQRLADIEYDDMTDEQKRIVDAGEHIAGTFPQGLSDEELSAWIMRLADDMAAIKRELADLTIMRSIDWSGCPLVQCDPEFFDGTPAMVSAPRVPVEALIHNHLDGETAHTIAYMFEVDEADVEQIIAYYQGAVAQG